MSDEVRRSSVSDRFLCGASALQLPESGAESGPPVSGRPTQAPFVGRAAEMAQMQVAVDDVLLANGRLILIAGDPGIGKTRIAHEVAVYARDRGLRVLWGRCHETGGAPAYWPWIQIVRALTRQCAPGELRALLGSAAMDVAQVVTELHDYLPELPSPPPLEPEEARFRLFDGIADFLKRAAKQQALMLICDDLQRADTASLRLLQFLASELVDVPILVLATYRDIEVVAEDPLFDTLSALAREPSTRHLELCGLRETEVAECIRLTEGVEPSLTLVSQVFRETEGNPFFVGEVVRLLAAEGCLDKGKATVDVRLTVPPSLNEVVARRIQRLSPACRKLLTVAAVIGREFELNVLGPALPGEALLAAVDEAVSARIITEGADGGRYRFTHVLIREVLYRQLTSHQRVQLHRQIGEILEGLHHQYPDAYLATLAHHFVAAAPTGDRDKAIDYAMKAAARATELTAHEEAARQYKAALQVLERTASRASTRFCDLLLLLSESFWRANEAENAKEAARRAMEIARSLGSAERLAQSALAFAGPLLMFGAAICDQETVALLEGALVALGEENSVLRATVMARLAKELAATDLHDRREFLCQEALGIARRAGDLEVLAAILKNTIWVSWVPGGVENRLQVASEIMHHARCTGNRVLRLGGHILRLLSLMELGDRLAVRAEFAECDRLAGELHQPHYVWVMATLRASLASMEGRLGDMGTLAQEALELGQRTESQEATLLFGTQLGYMLWLHGRLGELELMLLNLASTHPLQEHTIRCALAATYSEQGREAEARVEFEILAAHDFVDLSGRMNWLAKVAFLAEVCAFLGDARRARLLYGLLLPFERCNVLMHVCYSLGSASHYLGLLTTTLGNRQAAARHFEAALTMNGRAGAKQWVARTQVAYADLLLHGGSTGDFEKALALLAQALETARELEMPTVAAKVAALRAKAELPMSDSPRAIVTRTEPGDRCGVGGCALRKEGEFWTIAWAEGVWRLKDARGFHYLVHLLRYPGREFHAAEIISVAGGMPANGGPQTAVPTRESNQIVWRESNGGSILDASGATAYQRRCADLRDEIEEAERDHDVGRASVLHEELELLTHQLMLAARRRTFASAAERARLAVTKGIKAAVRRIAASDPRLGRYLATHVHTGYICVYRPDPDHPIRWDL